MLYAALHSFAQDGDNVLFVSPSLLEAAGRAEEWHMDGTFKVVPSMFNQLFTIHFVSFNHVRAKT